MSITLRSFSTTVSTAVASAQAACVQLLDLSVGSPGRALLESVGGVGLWLQYLALQILARTRLATSSGVDCDSFVNDFGMTRLPGVAASGMVTLTSFSSESQSAVVPVGVKVRTVAGVMFQVVEDSGNAAWSVQQGGYVRAVGVSAVTVPVQAVLAGSSGNVPVGSICLLGTSVSGIDTVTNAVPFVNGADGESDAALRLRFPLWLSAKSTASRAAVGAAVMDVQTNLSYSLMDGEMPDGSTTPGYFTVVVNDGSGAPSDAVLGEVYQAVDAVRAVGVGFAVQRPKMVVASVAMTVAVPSGVDASVAQMAIQAAVTQDIEICGVGSGYAYSRLAYIAYSSAGVQVLSVTDVLLNGAQADIPASTNQAIVVGMVSVSMNQGA